MFYQKKNNKKNPKNSWMCFLRDCFSCSTGDHPVGLLVHKCDFASARKIGTLYQRCLHSRAIIYLISLKLSFSSVAQSCPTLCDPVNPSMPGSSAHGIFQARILELGAISCSRRSSQPRDRAHISCVSCIGTWILYH